MNLHFFGRRHEQSASGPLPLPPAFAQSTGRGGIAPRPPHNSPPPQNQVLSDMLSRLHAYLPPPTPGLPSPDVSIVSLAEAPVGIGNLRGIEERGSFAAVVLKGGRLDGVVRFQLWADAPGDMDTAITALQGRLLDARDTLRAAGFLRIVMQTTSVSELLTALNAWRKTLDLGVLYEYHYEDDEGAQSLIAQIPVTIDGQFNESMLLTDEIVRWDKQATAPLVVDGLSNPGQQVMALTVLAFLPAGWDGRAVTIASSIGGVVRQQVFASVRALVNAFVLEPDTAELGGNRYTAGRLDFPNAQFPDPLLLRREDDSVRITYADPAFDQDAIVYLRVLS